MAVFISPFKNPFLNLALEDYFLREGTELPVLFFYVNRPCVVMGRFQNPWLETKLPYLAENDIWLVRRQSGGGSVFHDEGNLNFSFITREARVDRRRSAELIQRAFHRAGIELEISPRHDLWLGGKKISGSAFKQTKDGSFHHGTFLVNSDLEKLEEALRHTIVPKSTKSIPSVRSQVTCLTETHPGTEIQDVIELIAHELGEPAQELGGLLLSHSIVQESFRKHVSREWLWGETPAFELDELSITKGRLASGLEFSADSVRELMPSELVEQLFPNFGSQENESRLAF